MMGLFLFCRPENVLFCDETPDQTSASFKALGGLGGFRYSLKLLVLKWELLNDELARQWHFVCLMLDAIFPLMPISLET